MPEYYYRTSSVSTSETPEPEDLLIRNKEWAEFMTQRDPAYFQKLVSQQSPRYLWIGCSDSRVPANQIVGLAPGEMFVHRNVANLVLPHDINCLSVVQYAVEVLHVQHIIVSGHYGCGGIKAVLDGGTSGMVGDWLSNVNCVLLAHQHELDSLQTFEMKWKRLCELNVKAQVESLAQTDVIQTAWKRGQSLSIHGWIYGIEDGILRELRVTRDK